MGVVWEMEHMGRAKKTFHRGMWENQGQECLIVVDLDPESWEEWKIALVSEGLVSTDSKLTKWDTKK